MNSRINHSYWCLSMANWKKKWLSDEQLRAIRKAELLRLCGFIGCGAGGAMLVGGPVLLGFGALAVGLLFYSMTWQ
jgi:hypothetical protein